MGVTGLESGSSLVWPRRFSRALERLWESGLASRPQLASEAIIRAASRREGRAPADGAWRHRLDLLCKALRDEARLNSLGRTIAFGQLVRIVAARARAERWWTDHPEILERPLARSVVLVGQMRSGSTRLHRLLACDPDFAFTRTFESHQPVPPRGLWRWADPRPAAALLADRFLQLCNPALRPIHPASPFAAEEEFGLHAFSLWGAQFEAQWAVPSFAAACEGTDPADVYAEFGKLLQLVGWARGEDPSRGWLIKAPQFSQDLDALLGRFPDARIIRLKRSPDRVVASGASLAWHQMRIQSDHADRDSVGASWLRKTALREARLEASLARHPQVPRIDVDYDEVSADWAGAMARIYAFLDRPLRPVTMRRMARSLARSSDHHGHIYALEDFGLDRSAVARALG